MPSADAKAKTQGLSQVGGARARRAPHEGPPATGPLPGTPEAWEAFRQAQREKVSLARRLRRDEFRLRVAQVCDTADMWKLGKWARHRSHLPAQRAGIPSLRCPDGSIAETNTEKEAALAEAFFPELRPHAEPTGPYPTSVTISALCSPGDVLAALRTTSASSAPGPDGIPNSLLKAIAAAIAGPISALIQAAWQCGHHPTPFRSSRTIPVKKPQKPDYRAPKAWRPIALLNTIGKIAEKVLATRLRDEAEAHGLLPLTQMGARPERSTESALALLTDQIRAAWALGAEASVLALDVSGAFDRVPASRLDHALARRRIPEWVRRVVGSFMHHHTVLDIPGLMATPRLRTSGIPQGSPLSPILFLFFSGDLLDTAHRPQNGIAATGFVDDVTCLAVSKTTTGTLRKLRRVHQACEQWAADNGAVLAPDKYELMHMSRKRGPRPQATLRLGELTLTPAARLRFLGVWLDPALRWDAHRRAVEAKLQTQTLTLSRLTASTWGASFAQARHLYAVAVRPAITYGHIAWDEPNGNRRPVARALDKAQSKCLRVVCGAFRSTPLKALQSETAIPPLLLHLDKLGAAAWTRYREGPVGPLSSGICTALQAHLSRSMRPAPRPTAPHGSRLAQWSAAWDDQATGRWRQDFADDGNKALPERESDMSRAQWKRVRDHHSLHLWRDAWPADPPRHPLTGHLQPTPRYTLPPREWCDARQDHENLSKASSAMLLQARSGHIGLAAYLAWRQVPDFGSPQCECGHEPDTVPHRLAGCPARPGMPSPDASDSRTAPHLPKDERARVLLQKYPQATARWLLGSVALPQFGWARQHPRQPLQPQAPPPSTAAADLSISRPPPHVPSPR